MRLHFILGLLAVTGGAAALAQTPAGNQDPPDNTGTFSLKCSPAQIEHNTRLAGLFRLDGDPDVAYRQMTLNYAQHNPMARRIGEVNGVSGRDEFKLMLDMKKQGKGSMPPLLPGQPPEDTYHFVMADCDHVFLLKKSYLPDPQHLGQFYPVFDFDLWRIENGKLAEHWDDMRIPEQVPDVLKMPVKDLKPPPKPVQ